MRRHRPAHRSVRSRVRGWLWTAAERSVFWSTVLRAVRARRRLRHRALGAAATVQRGIWSIYYRSRRTVRTRVWSRTRASHVAPRAPRGRSSADERFARSERPLIRWIKGDGLDDEVTRSAIAQATRLFGGSVDYCLCTAGISPARARAVLAWAEHP